MDRVKVNAGALISADNALNELTNNICATITKCKSDIKNEFVGIDNDLQKDLLEYLDKFDSLERNISNFNAENSRAIHERIARISEYSATAYKPRNIK